MFKPDFLDVRKIFFKLNDIFVVGSAPTVNALVVIADNSNVFVRQEAHHFVLLMARVLKFIDHNILVAFFVAGEHVGELAEKFYRQHDKVVKVHCVEKFEPALIAFVQFLVHIVRAVPFFAPRFDIGKKISDFIYIERVGSEL